MALLLPLFVLVMNVSFRPSVQHLSLPQKNPAAAALFPKRTIKPHRFPSLQKIMTNTSYIDAPKPIALRPLSANSNNATNSLLLSPLEQAVQHRHKCLSFIRKRHFQLLGPLIIQGEHVLLVDPAYHANVGDHMLTVGEQVFLKTFSNQWQECDYVQANKQAPPCTSVIASSLSSTNNKLAMWHAGGNWGDLWRIAQTKRMDSFRPLLRKNYTILGMPQSLHYIDNATQQKDVEKIKNDIVQGGIDSKKRVIFTWREEYSFQRAQEMYPFVTNLIVPDIAFQLGPYERSDPAKVDILVFLRDDLESKYAEKRKASYIRDKIPRNTTFQLVDWPDRLDLFDSKDILFTQTSIQLLSLGKIVIADRLHASILAYLSGIPFVYLDQSTNKLTKTLSVAFDSWDGCHDSETSLWSKATDLDEALTKAVEYIDRYRL